MKTVQTDRVVVLRGLWTPTQEEVDRLVGNVDEEEDRVTWKVPGQTTSFIYKGPIDNEDGLPTPGHAYFFAIQGAKIAGSSNLKRVVYVYSDVEEGFHERYPTLDLDYFLRPLTLLEAMRALRAGSRKFPKFIRDRGGEQDRVFFGHYTGAPEKARIELYGVLYHEVPFEEAASLCDWADLEADNPPKGDWRRATEREAAW